MTSVTSFMMVAPIDLAFFVAAAFFSRVEPFLVLAPAAAFFRSFDRDVEALLFSFLFLVRSRWTAGLARLSPRTTSRRWTIATWSQWTTTGGVGLTRPPSY